MARHLPSLAAGNGLLAGARAILFDLDGTLVETAIDFDRMRAEVRRLAQGCGLNAEALAARDVLGMIRAAAAQLPEPQSFLARAEAALVAVELAALPGAREMPGARDLLLRLQGAGFKVGIVTRNCRPAAVALVDTFLLAHDTLLTRDDVPHVKPHPDHLLTAARRLGASPAETVMVGDHPLDVQGGRAAGMRTLRFLGPSQPDRDETLFEGLRPDAVVRHLSEIAAWISPS